MDGLHSRGRLDSVTYRAGQVVWLGFALFVVFILYLMAAELAKPPNPDWCTTAECALQNEDHER